MALGNSFTQESPLASPGTFAVELREAVGRLCEVRALNNTLIFLGRVQDFDGRALSVWPAGGKEAPPVIYNDEFKLVLHIPEKPTLVWRGCVCGSSHDFWKFHRLNRCHFKEQRVNFRQPVSLRARVLCINTLYPGAPRRADTYYARFCKVVDISLGGIQFRGQENYSIGDRLLITDLWLDESQPQPFVFTVQVRWCEQVSRVESRFGCSLEVMSIRDEDRLCAAIFELQRTDIANH